MVRARVHPGVVLDARLALFHEEAGWLAVADVHYGYSQVMREAGGLFPHWGNRCVEERLAELCREYQPGVLVIVGDLVHGRVKRDVFASFLTHLEGLAPELVLIQGNHDGSPTVRAARFVESWAPEGFFFHHGHLSLEPPEGVVEVTGHYHPATSVADGAGLRLKMPTLIQEETRGGRRRWILPAFSPWAGGTHWRAEVDGKTRRWVCSPRRVFEWV